MCPMCRSYSVLQLNNVADVHCAVQFVVVQCVVVLAYNNFIMWQMCSSYSLQQLYNVADVQYSYGVCTLYTVQHDVQ